MTFAKKLRQAAQRLHYEALTVYCVARHPDTPKAVRFVALAIAAYAVSPIDLIPDFIPVVGYLDDVILLPLAIWLVLKLTPSEVIADSRARAAAMVNRPVSHRAACVVVALWVALAALVGYSLWSH